MIKLQLNSKKEVIKYNFLNVAFSNKENAYEYSLLKNSEIKNIFLNSATIAEFQEKISSMSLDIEEKDCRKFKTLKGINNTNFKKSIVESFKSKSARRVFSEMLENACDTRIFTNFNDLMSLKLINEKFNVIDIKLFNDISKNVESAIKEKLIALEKEKVEKEKVEKEKLISLEKEKAEKAKKEKAEKGENVKKI